MAVAWHIRHGTGNRVPRRPMYIMSDPKRQRNREVRFVFSGMGTVVKSVTKTTTCDDVIRKLPTQPVQIAVYESVNGAERELSGKTRLLKVLRAHGSTTGVYFVIKKSGEQTRNLHSKRKIFSGLNPKSKLQTFARRLSQTNITLGSLANKSKRTDKANPSLDSLDDSLSYSDVGKMYRFLKADSTSSRSRISSTPSFTKTSTTSLSRVNKQVVDESLHTMKLGFRKELASNESIHSRVTVGAEHTKRMAVDEPDSFGNPRHSTPVIGGADHPRKRSRFHLPSTPTILKASSRNGRTSKHTTRRTVLVDEFAADEILSNTMRHDTSRGTTSSRARNPEFRTSSRAMIPEFRSQEEHCRYIWNRNCDIDSDSSFDSDTSCAGSQLDVAFWDPAPSPTPNKHAETSTEEFTHSRPSFDLSYSSDESSLEEDITPYSLHRAGHHGCWSGGEWSGVDSDEGIGSMSSGSSSSFRDRLLSLV